MYRKILVPLDGSAQALKALDFAVDLAQKYDASLSLLHIITNREVPESVRTFAEAEHMDMPPDWIYEQQVGEKILGKCKQQARFPCPGPAACTYPGCSHPLAAHRSNPVASPCVPLPRTCAPIPALPDS